MIAEAGRLVQVGQLGDGRGEIGRRNGRREFERSLRRKFFPAALFEQAQHFRVFERSERRGQVAAAAGAQAPTRNGVANHRAAAENE